MMKCGKTLMSFQIYIKELKSQTFKKKEKKADIFSRMLNNFIENTKKGKMPGSWNDYGRLL